MIERFEDLTLYDMEKLDNLKKSFKIGTNNSLLIQNQCCANKNDRLCKGCKAN